MYDRVLRDSIILLLLLLCACMCLHVYIPHDSGVAFQKYVLFVARVVRPDHFVAVDEYF